MINVVGAVAGALGLMELGNEVEVDGSSSRSNEY